MKFYVEIYTRHPICMTGGWDIEVLEIEADSEKEARARASKHAFFDCVITSGPIFEED